MLNKEEIIIDGVNVAGCVRLQDDNTSCNLGGECRGWENCYYKQLKHLEKENETLRITREKLLSDLYIVEETLKDYEAHYIRSEQENDKYKHALEQIREISKPVDELCRNCEHDRFLCDNECECNAYRLEQVQNKINEALESED